MRFAAAHAVKLGIPC